MTYDPSMPLPSTATDEQIEERGKFYAARRSFHPFADAAREFAAACLATRPSREQVEALRQDDDELRYGDGFNVALDEVLALYPETEG